MAYTLSMLLIENCFLLHLRPATQQAEHCLNQRRKGQMLQLTTWQQQYQLIEFFPFWFADCSEGD